MQLKLCRYLIERQHSIKCLVNVNNHNYGPIKWKSLTLINLLFHVAPSHVPNLNQDMPVQHHLLSYVGLPLWPLPHNLLRLSWNTITEWQWSNACRHKYCYARRLTHHLSNCCIVRLQPVYQPMTGRVEPLLDSRNNPYQLML